MKRSIILSLALAAWCGAGLNHASAQFGTLGQPPARPRPTVSPFLNLGEGANPFNYYGLVKPQVDANRAINQLQTGQALLNPDGSMKSPLAPTQTNALGGLQTGHPATFFNYGHYYPNNPYGGTTGFGTGSLGSGLGGYGATNLGGGTNIGVGVNTGGATGRTFFGPTLNVGPR